MRTLVLVPVSLVFFLLIAGHAPAHAGGSGVVTGCVGGDGSVVKLALGEAPNRPCNERQLRLSLGIDGLGGTGPERFELDQPRDPAEQTRAVDGAIVLKLHFPF